MSNLYFTCVAPPPPSVMGQGPSSCPATDFSRVNSLRPVSERRRRDHQAPAQDTMYQSLRSYVGKCQLYSKYCTVSELFRSLQ